MALEVENASRPWSFIKTHHEAAYKQLPIEPDRAKFAMVDLRRPGTGAWFSFKPRSLLFGAETAAPRYNFLLRILGVLINRIFGIPLATYFDDIGALSPSELDQLAHDTVEIFFIALGIFLKKDKTGLGREMALLGLRGAFPGPDNGMALEITPPEDKRKSWAEMMLKF